MDGIGVRLIVGYKIAKAGAELLLGALLLTLGSASLAEGLRAVALTVRHHAAEAWSIELAERLVQVAAGRNLVVALALLLDGVSSLVEGWALHRRYRWSRWLIVGATSCLLPFEVVALIRHLAPGRVVLLLGNALIVAYLIQRRVAAAQDSE